MIEASSLEPSSVTPSVAGVPLSASEPVFKSLDDALEWCEEFFLCSHTAPTTPPMLSPAEILEIAESAPSSSSGVNGKRPLPPTMSIRDGDQPLLSSSEGGLLNGDVTPGSPRNIEGFARHPSYYRTMQATRSPSGAKRPAHVDDEMMASSTSSSSATDALVAILEDYLQLPAASSPLRVPSAKIALAQHFTRKLVMNISYMNESQRIYFH